MIDWSYDLCSPSRSRRCWARLSVFAGGFELEAAEDVCAGDGIARGRGAGPAGRAGRQVDPDCRDGAGRGARYRLLETLRAVRTGTAARSPARTRRCGAGTGTGTCELVRQADRRLVRPADRRTMDPRLRGEHANVRAALDFCLRRRARPSRPRIAAAWWRHRLAEGPPARDTTGWTGRWPPTAARFPCRAGQGPVGRCVAPAVLQGDLLAAQPLLRECRALAERLGDEAQLARPALHITGSRRAAGTFARSFTLLEEALVRRRALGHRGGSFMGRPLQLSMVAVVISNDPRSTTLCQELSWRRFPPRRRTRTGPSPTRCGSTRPGPLAAPRRSRHRRHHDARRA